MIIKKEKPTVKNKEKKRELVENGSFQYYLIERNKVWNEDKEKIIGKTYQELADYFGLTEEEAICMEQMRKSKSMQRKEIRRHINFLINMDYDLIFSTYTLTDKALNENNLDVDYIRDKLTNQLRKSGAKDWIGNVDYGSLHERLHFHVIEAYEYGVITKEINDKRNRSLFKTPEDEYWNEKMGYTNHEEIGKNLNDEIRTSLYLAKLTAHTIKKKTKRIFTNKRSLYRSYKRKLDLTFWNDETMMKRYCAYIRLKEEEKKGRKIYKPEIIEQYNLLKMEFERT